MKRRTVRPEEAHDSMCWSINLAFSVPPDSMSVEDIRGFVTPDHIVRWLAERVPMADDPQRDLRDAARADVVRELAEVLGRDARELSPTSRLEDLVRREGRRDTWTKLVERIHAPPLELPKWLENSRAIATAFLALGPLLAANILGLVGVSGWILAAEVVVLFLLAGAIHPLLGWILRPHRLEIPATAANVDAIATLWILDGKVPRAHDDAWTLAEMSEFVRSIAARSYGVDARDVHADTPLPRQ